MPWSESPYLILGILNAAIALASVLWIWQRRPARGARTFATAMLCMAAWSATDTFGRLSFTEAAKLFWARASYLPAVTVPVALLAFVLRYGQRKKPLTRRQISLLAIEPFLTLLLVWPNEAHGWIWRSVAVDTTLPYLSLRVTHGPWFWFHTAYSYLLLALSVSVLIRGIRHSTALQRRQGLALLIGGLASWIAVAVSTAFPHLGQMAIAAGATVSNVAIIWSMLRLRIFDFVPVACEAVVEQMDASVIVLDTQNRILDLNAAAQKLIGHSASEVLGQTAERVFAAYPQLLGRWRGAIQVREELAWGEGDTRRWYDLRISPLRDPEGELAGRLVVLHEITARKRLEAETEQRRLYLESVVGSAPDAIIALDSQHTIVEWNRGAESLFGYSAQEARGRDLDDLVTGSDPRTFQEATALTARVLVGEPVPPTEVVRYRKDGTPVHVFASGSPILMGEELIGVVVIYTDISELKQAEEALRQSEARYRAVVQAQTELITRFLPDGTLTFANDAACRYLGKKREELIGSHYASPVPDKDRKMVEEALASLSREDPVIMVENRVIAANGETRWLQWTNRAIFNEQGQLVEIQSVGRDITESKLAQDALLEAEAKYRTLVDTSPDGITLTNLAGKIVLCNRQTARLHGYDLPEDIHGMSTLDLIAPQDHDRARANLQRTLARGSIHNIEYTMLRKDGSRFPAELSTSVIRDATLKPTGFIAVIRDATARKRGQEQLRASLREKELLLNEINHRVRDNLQIISSLLYLQSLQAEGQSSSEILRDSQNRVRSMALVHEKLYGSRDLSRIDFEEYVQSLTASLLQSYAAASSGIGVTVEVDDVFLSVDLAIPCSLLISELVSNALKHAFVGRDSGEIRVEFHAQDERYRLEVSDNGVGIPEDIDTRDPESLGLQLVNTLVEQLRGTLRVQHQDGTQFRITFPTPEEG